MGGEVIDWDHNVYTSQEADKNLHVKFFLHPKQDDVKSADAGRPIFDELEFVEIRVRGDRINMVSRPAHDGDRQRFAGTYAAFKAGNAEQHSGTMLSAWPPMTRAMVEELKYFGFYTVEQLAQASDSVCSKFAGLTTWKQKAAAFLAMSAGSSAPLEKLTAKLGELSNEKEVADRNMKEMADTIKELQNQLAKMNSAPAAARK